MLKVGITGGIGSGKSAVTAQLEALGITIVDADIVAREVVQPGEPALAQVADQFGQHLITELGELDRRALREIVFAEQEKRLQLEKLLHPLINQRIHQRLENSSDDYVVLSSPLLFESKQSKMTDFQVVVDCPEELQLERTFKRDNSDQQQIRSIMSAQLPRQERLKKADKVISNSGTLAELQAATDSLHQFLLELSRNS